MLTNPSFLNMRAYIFLLISLTGSGIFFWSCDGKPGSVKGEGPVVENSKALGLMTSLKLKGSYAVNLIQSNENKIMLKTNKNLQELISISELDDGLVSIESEKSLSSPDGIELTIYFKDLDYIISSGAIALENEDVLQFDSLTLDFSGAGATEMNMNASYVRVISSGAGATELSGITQWLEAEISGIGALDAQDLEATHARIKISGVGGAEITATDRLYVDISGVGGVEYCGNPEVEKSISGLGGISQCEEDNNN